MAVAAQHRPVGSAAAANRRDPRSFHPFLRLQQLLAEVAPGTSPLPDGSVVNLAIGDPQRAAPPLLAAAIAAYPDRWSRYPPFRGLPSYHDACAAWLSRRYDLPAGLIDGERHLMQLPGSREGLFFATLAAASLGAAEGRSKVLLPAPAYHVYAGGAAAAGIEPVFVPTTADGGFLPDFAALDPAVLDAAAIAFVCSPSNPEGAALDLAGWQSLITLARRHGFLLAADECYADIYTGAPPSGVLEAAAALGGGFDQILAFHSLSKRSNAAGLRCGFVAGEPRLIDTIDAFLRVGGAGVPVPVMHAGAVLWSDDDHAAENRAFYQGLFDLAEKTLDGRFDWRKPAGGFFLWLKVGDGEAATVELWRRAGLRVLPGAYMCPLGEGRDNPAAPYIRVALVYEPEVMAPALSRLVEILDR
jgi:aspartate/methionine/tyrosine aminotransferase